MNVVVLTKWVPEPEGTPALGPDNLLVREGADGALDPGDEYGLEAALQLVEAAGDGEITLLTMGPEVAHAALQRGLAMGAHKGVRITDDSLRGADSLVTARVLAAAIKRQPFDLVVGGVESTDGYTGIVPAAIAELLGVPSLTFASTRRSAIRPAVVSSYSTVSPPCFGGASVTSATVWVAVTSSLDRPRSAMESVSTGFDFAAITPFSEGYRGSVAPAVTVMTTGRVATTTS